MSYFPFYDSFPPVSPVIELTDINTALNNLSFSGFTNLGVLDSNGQAGNVFFGTQSTNDSGFLGSMQSSNNVFSNHLDRSSFQQNITELLPLVPSIELQSTQQQEEKMMSISHSYTYSQMLEEETMNETQDSVEPEFAVANGCENDESQFLPLSDLDFFSKLNEYSATLGPIVEKFQDFLDDNLETFTQKEIISKLQALRAVFEDTKPNKAK